jgi:hypothetical protein
MNYAIHPFVYLFQEYPNNHPYLGKTEGGTIHEGLDLRR